VHWGRKEGNLLIGHGTGGGKKGGDLVPNHHSTQPKPSGERGRKERRSTQRKKNRGIIWENMKEKPVSAKRNGK